MNLPTNKIRTIIVDDEASIRENLTMLLKEFCPRIEVCDVAESIEQARQLIEDYEPEIMFLDIQIGSRTIFEFLQAIPEITAEIIFVSAHDHFALRAFKFMAIDYLLKPIDIPQLIKAVDRACTTITQKNYFQRFTQLTENLSPLHHQHKIAFSTSDGYEFIFVDQIMYCTADGSYTHIFFMDRDKLVLSKHLKFYEELLLPYGFIRVHLSCLVNPKHIRAIERINGGSLIMENGKSLPISKTVRIDLIKGIKKNRRLE